MTPASKRRLRARIHTTQGGRCFWCGRPTALPLPGQQRMIPDTATLDHVVPRAHGGAGGGNLVLACWRCNQRRAAALARAPVRVAVLARLEELGDLASALGLAAAADGDDFGLGALTDLLADVEAACQRLRPHRDALPAAAGLEAAPAGADAP